MKDLKSTTHKPEMEKIRLLIPEGGSPVKMTTGVMKWEPPIL